MSILIKGMDMPKTVTTLVVFPNGCVACYDVKDNFIAETKATELPPHGRLIDADAFEKANAYFWGRDFINPKYSDTLADLVNAAPTVIPASNEKDNEKD